MLPFINLLSNQQQKQKLFLKLLFDFVFNLFKFVCELGKFVLKDLKGFIECYKTCKLLYIVSIQISITFNQLSKVTTQFYNLIHFNS